MTICVSVKVPEGLIFSCDSAITMTQTVTKNSQSVTQIVQSFNYGNKLAQIKDYPIGVMCWGVAGLSERTIHSLIMEFENGYAEMNKNKNYKVEKVASDLIDFIKKRYNDHFQTTTTPQTPLDNRILGLAIGGFSAKQFFAEQYVYEFPNSVAHEVIRPNRPDGQPDFGANWWGLTDALTRLIVGFDPPSLEQLVNRGADRQIVQQWVNDNVSQLPLIFNGMPLQDAIDFAEYCVQVVIGRYRFGAGIPLCGGDVDIAVIRPNSFKWSKHKQWSIKD